MFPGDRGQALLHVLDMRRVVNLQEIMISPFREVGYSVISQIPEDLHIFEVRVLRQILEDGFDCSEVGISFITETHSYLKIELLGDAFADGKRLRVRKIFD